MHSTTSVRSPAHEIFAYTFFCRPEGMDKKATINTVVHSGRCAKIYKGIAFTYTLMQGQSDIKQFSSFIK